MIQNDWITDLYGTADTVTISGSTMNMNTSPYINNINTVGVATSPGYILTTGTSGTNWADVVISSNPAYNSLEVKGDANFDGDVKIKGKSLSETLDRLEERLAILRPNESLEEKWEQLKDLRRQYREMEKDILEKEKIWEILKK